MEAVLEDGRLDVVPFLAFIEGDGLDLTPGLGLLYLAPSEVPPALLAFLVQDLDLPFVVFHGDGVDDLARLLVSHLKGVLVSLFQIEARGLALYAARNEIYPVLFGKLAVVLALVGSVRMQGLDLASRDILGALHARLHVGVVGSRGPLHVDVGDQAGLALFVAGLGDAGRKSLSPLVLQS